MAASGGDMADRDPTQEMFELWRKSLEEGTQAWLKTITQTPPADVTQFWRPILEQGMEFWAKGMGQVGAPDPAQQWKRFVDLWLEAWSKALGQAMATEGFARALGRHMDQWLTAQGPWRKAAEQSSEAALKALGLPGRAQVAAMAEQLTALEERVDRLDDRLDEVKQLLEGLARSPADRAAVPRRTTGRKRS